MRPRCVCLVQRRTSMDGNASLYLFALCFACIKRANTRHQGYHWLWLWRFHGRASLGGDQQCARVALCLSSHLFHSAHRWLAGRASPLGARSSTYQAQGGRGNGAPQSGTCRFKQSGTIVGGKEPLRMDFRCGIPQSLTLCLCHWDDNGHHFYLSFCYPLSFLI